MSAATSSRSEMVSGSPGAGDSKSPLSQQWPTITYLFFEGNVAAVSAGHCDPRERNRHALLGGARHRAVALDHPERVLRAVAAGARSSAHARACIACAGGRRTARGAALPSCRSPASGTSATRCRPCPAQANQSERESCEIWRMPSARARLHDGHDGAGVGQQECSGLDLQVQLKGPRSVSVQISQASSPQNGGCAPCGRFRWRRPRRRLSRARR